MSRRLRLLKTVLWALVGLLVPVTIARFRFGLGAVTNLSDGAPWGLWVGFDVMAGVALAAGGFVMAAAVHVLHLERYRGFVRPAILTAWLGYVAVAVGLLYDLGLPWHIWHPAIYPQHHSVLFEVAACVMLYLTVLTLEFAPTALEHPRLQRRWLQSIYRALRRATIPLVIAGIVLSTLHQSSLGSLFLITPHRLHPLWYSPILPVLFFVSAVALGLMTVVLESLIAAAFLGHRLHRELLSGLGRVASGVLLLYLALRLGDLAARGTLATIGTGWQGKLFVLELAVSAFIPAMLLLSPAGKRTGGVGVAAALVVAGMVGYRLDVSVVAFARPAGVSYFPSWMEFAVSLGIVALAALVFLFFAERLRVYEDVSGPAAPEPARAEASTVRWLLPARLAGVRRYSRVALAAAIVAIPFLPLGGRKRPATPVAQARTVAAVEIARPEAVGHTLDLADPDATVDATVDSGGERAGVRLVLAIDGNRDGRMVLFDHSAHEQRVGGDAACAVCHHLNLPLDRNSSCSACHRDMYEPTATFSHRAHTRALPGAAGCGQCHDEASPVRTMASATTCVTCHKETPALAASPIAAPHEQWRDAAGYLETMHGLCVRCHERTLAEDTVSHPAGLAECNTCHDADLGPELRRELPQRQEATLPAPGKPTALGMPAAKRPDRPAGAGK